MKLFKQFLWHPWYWDIIPRVTLYYRTMRPRPELRRHDVGFSINWLCLGFHIEIGKKMPWDRLIKKKMLWDELFKEMI